MGAYLAHPVREKELASGEDSRLRWASAAQQGWRLSHEDATAAVPALDAHTAFFGVFDGHGGAEVARYCAAHLHGALLASPAYAAGDLAAALGAAFLAVDRQIGTPEGRRELRLLAEAAAAQGHPAGEEAAVLSAKVRAGLLRNAAALGTSAAELAALAEALDADAAAAAARPRGGPDAGAAALVALLRGSQLLVANAGDCRAVLCRAGAAVELSTDHKPCSPAEAARITAAGSYLEDGRVNGCLALSRAIGDHQFKTNAALPAAAQAITAQPDVRCIELQDGDEFLILACDGIWDVVSSQQAVEFIRARLRAGSGLAEAAAALCDACTAPDTGGSGLGCDNMSVVLVVPTFAGGCGVSGSGGEELGSGCKARSGGGGARQAAAAAARAHAAAAAQDAQAAALSARAGALRGGGSRKALVSGR